MGLVSRTGTSRSGDPLSFSRTPAADLARHIARFFVTIIDRPTDDLLEDFLLHDAPYVRTPVHGSWEARIGNRWVAHDGPMLFGAQRKPFQVRCVGPIVAAGFAIRPAAWFTFWPHPAEELADRLAPLDDDWGEALRWACEDVRDHEQTFARMETVVRRRIAATNPAIDPAMERFETIARLDPTRSVGGIAEELNMSQRRLDRAVCHHFGHSPKTVLRRSRFLDMAAVMRGLAVPGVDADAALRFYDASHLNREFRLFVDMTPAQFARARTPLMTLGIEVRQQRKLADLAALAPGEPVPWLPPAGSNAADVSLKEGNGSGVRHAG